MAAAAAPKFNTKSPTIRRILREAQELAASPSPDYHATPLETDLFEWHFTLRGPPNSPFESGAYHGRIVLPASYPLRPPSFRFLTPSGRFEPNREICLSISGHHEETWQPAWGLRTALVALRSFMETDVRGQLGGLEAAEPVRRRLAAESVAWRCAAACCGGKTNGEVLAECEERARDAGGPAAAVSVPDELRLGWRDEMGAAGGAGNKTARQQQRQQQQQDGRDGEDEDEESARLAEGFVQTTSVAIASTSGPGGREAGEGSAVPPTMRPGPAPNPPGVAAGPASQQVAQPRVSNDDVPAWLDRLIIALAILLAAVVAKVMLA